MKNKWFFISIILLVLTQCDNKRIYEKNINIPDKTWDYHRKIKFEFNINDSTIPYNIYINLRNTALYQYQNLYLFIKLILPNDSFFVDTVECILADDNGQWFGRGLGDIYFNQILYKKNVYFPYCGKYCFEFVHGMREEKLKNIMDIGLRVEKNQK